MRTPSASLCPHTPRSAAPRTAPGPGSGSRQRSAGSPAPASRSPAQNHHEPAPQDGLRSLEGAGGRGGPGAQAEPRGHLGTGTRHLLGASAPAEPLIRPCSPDRGVGRALLPGQEARVHRRLLQHAGARLQHRPLLQDRERGVSAGPGGCRGRRRRWVPSATRATGLPPAGSGPSPAVGCRGHWGCCVLRGAGCRGVLGAAGRWVPQGAHSTSPAAGQASSTAASRGSSSCWSAASTRAGRRGAAATPTAWTGCAPSAPSPAP